MTFEPASLAIQTNIFQIQWNILLIETNIFLIQWNTNIYFRGRIKSVLSVRLGRSSREFHLCGSDSAPTAHTISIILYNSLFLLSFVLKVFYAKCILCMFSFVYSVFCLLLCTILFILCMLCIVCSVCIQIVYFAYSVFCAVCIIFWLGLHCTHNLYYRVQFNFFSVLCELCLVYFVYGV